MSNPAILHRCFSIIKRLQKKPYPSMEQLIAHVEDQLEDYREKDSKANAGTHKRTLRRDFTNIRNLFGLTIAYSKKEDSYSIAESGIKDHFLQQMADSFAMLQMLNLAEAAQTTIHPQPPQQKGKEHFGPLFGAIRDKVQVQFTYHKHWEDAPTERTFCPYQLREAGNRWYVIRLNEGKVKTFALDRITDMVVTNTPFTPPANPAYEAIYQHTFGIDGPHEEDDAVHDVVLSFEHHQGKYVRDLPLHRSQQILEHDGPELHIRLRLYITRDLVMKILSYGETVTVLAPPFLADQVKKELKITLKKYH